MKNKSLSAITLIKNMQDRNYQRNIQARNDAIYNLDKNMLKTQMNTLESNNKLPIPTK